MSPTIVLSGGKPIMTLGAAGGPKIITQVLLALVRTLDCGQSLESAAAAPRLHHQWSPDVLYVETGFPPSTADDLARLGQAVKPLEGAGVCQAIGLGADGSTFIGVHDPRAPGKAIGW
jgi:gamma-glutamyltranspeptidase/glutathione hydrolase